MPETIRIAPSNSLLFIEDISGGEIPVTVGPARLWSTSSCIAIGCLASMDGETEVTLGASDQVSPEWEPAFDGILKTPTRKVVVSTVEGDNVLVADVASERTRVRIWTNHPIEPDKVSIGLN
jgi:hypothetical protein